MTVTAAHTVDEPDEELGRGWTCFAIGPIGDPLAEVGSLARTVHESALEIYENIMQAACRPFGIVPVRADELPGTGEIFDQICQQMKDADLVIADLSGLNPNVIFELALRQGTGKPTIQLSDGGDLPYYLSKVRTIRFRRSRSGLVQAREELRRTLQAGLRNGFDVLTPARILSGTREEPDEPPGPSPEDEDRLGLIEAIVQIETDVELMTADMTEIGTSILALGSVTESFNPDFARIGKSGSFKNSMALMVRYATAITGPADDLEAAASRFVTRMQGMDSGIRGALEFVDSTTRADWPESTEEFLYGMITLSVTAEESLSQVREFVSVLAWAGNFSRAVRRPFRRIADSLIKVDNSSSCIHEWASIAQRLLDRPVPMPSDVVES